jgi:hypothetical protein
MLQMRSPMRAAVPLAVAAGLIAAAPAAQAEPAPAARAAGGAVSEPTYPSAVRTRVGRTERALERAIKKIEAGKQDEAAVTLKVVRRQLAASWRAARYIVRTAPPPAPPVDDKAVKGRARASGGAPAGLTFASPPETAVRVLTLQHDVAADVAQLVDGAHGSGLAPISTTLNLALDRRDAALRDILRLAPPAPPVPADKARASQEDAPPTFDTLMPGIVPQFDDEIQGIDVLKSDATDVTAGGLRLLNAAEAQLGRTKAFVTTTWPPAPVGD